ncbi:hypothetical protein C3488_18925 [Streptomyces sp. Ru72]|nr:hypothetical protein C3488_18925 [Streptomyces sp. Ru72]
MGPTVPPSRRGRAHGRGRPGSPGAGDHGDQDAGTDQRDRQRLGEPREAVDGVGEHAERPNGSSGPSGRGCGANPRVPDLGGALSGLADRDPDAVHKAAEEITGRGGCGWCLSQDAEAAQMASAGLVQCPGQLPVSRSGSLCGLRSGRGWRTRGMPRETPPRDTRAGELPRSTVRFTRPRWACLIPRGEPGVNVARAGRQLAWAPAN